MERIVDRRRSRKGRVEYLVRWRGYGSESDTWEPETHLSACMSYVHEFNRRHLERDAALLRSTRGSPCGAIRPEPRPPTEAPPPDSFGPARRSVDLAKSGIKILVPRSPMNPRPDSEDSPSEATQSLEAGAQEAGAQEAHPVPPEVALLEKPVAIQLAPGQERARMGTRPRNQNPLPSLPPPAPMTPMAPAAVHSLCSSGESY